MKPNYDRAVLLLLVVIDVELASLIDVSILVALVLNVVHDSGFILACALCADAQCHIAKSIVSKIFLIVCLFNWLFLFYLFYFIFIS